MLELNRISAGYGKQTVLNDVSAFFEKGKEKKMKELMQIRKQKIHIIKSTEGSKVIC